MSNMKPTNRSQVQPKYKQPRCNSQEYQFWGLHPKAPTAPGLDGGTIACQVNHELSGGFKSFRNNSTYIVDEIDDKYKRHYMKPLNYIADPMFPINTKFGVQLLVLGWNFGRMANHVWVSW